MSLSLLSVGYAWGRHSASRFQGYSSMVELKVNYATQCQWTCYFDGNCDSVNYRPLDMSCQLMTQFKESLINATDILMDAEWEFWLPTATKIN